MSSFDGLSSVDNLLSRAKQYNWPVIGIADKFNVQAYPEIINFSKKINQKVIYGTEIDLCHDKIDIVLNQIEANITTSEYVIFDIETTGLVNEYDEIIEFGGIKVNNGNIVDRIDFFIKPKKQIPSHITKITRINQQMVDDAQTIVPCLKKIVN
jgi:DNA polymerase-3 subunit alpha (Gram-positive type)